MRQRTENYRRIIALNLERLGKMSMEAKNQEVLDTLHKSGVSWVINMDTIKEVEVLKKEIERAASASETIIMRSAECTAAWSGHDIGAIINILHIFYMSISLHKGLEEMEKESAE